MKSWSPCINRPLAGVTAVVLSVALLSGCVDTAQSAGRGTVDTAVAGPLDDEELRAELRDIIRDVNARYGARSGIAVATSTGVVQSGLPGNTWAWSTIKVPVAVAADAEGAPEELIEASITWSDNVSAYTLTTSIDHDLGDLPYTPQIAELPGETMWDLRDQARFAAQLPCVDVGGTTYAAMGDIIDWQQVGLARIPGARFKGGWGADSGSVYTLRQLGAVEIDDGVVGLAVLTHPDDRTPETAEKVLDAIGVRLGSLLDARAIAPAAICQPG